MDSAQPAKRGGRSDESAASTPAETNASSAKTIKTRAAAMAKSTEKTDKVVKLEDLVEPAASQTNDSSAQETASESSADKSVESKSAENGEVMALSIQAAGTPAKANSNKVPIMGSIFDRPIGSSAIEVYEEYSEAGLRPVGASHMHVYGTIFNGRPIMASEPQVLDLTFPGQRPVFASGLQVRDDLTLPGGRPIMASDDRLMDAALLPGGRPIASNDINNDMTDFIGYMD